MVATKLVKLCLVIAIFVNVLYFAYYYYREEIRQTKLHLAGPVVYETDDQVYFDPNSPYESLKSDQKIAYLLKQVESDKDRFWLAHNEIFEPSLTIDVSDHLQSEQGSWANKPSLFYDPRFTFSIYLNELKYQLETKNPENIKSLDKLISMPFSWSDWVNLTMLNEELEKPIEERLDCSWLQSKINKPTKYPKFCKNLLNLTDEELLETGFTSKEFLPGFVVKNSPMNKAPHKQVMMQGKGHLLSYQENPLSIIFLTKYGTYEVQIDEKKRIAHTELFENYLRRKNFDFSTNSITLNPVEELNTLIESVPSRPLDPSDDLYSVHQIIHQKNENSSREIYLDPDAFDYSKEQVQEQIQYYETRLNLIDDLVSNELHYDIDKIEKYSLNRHELNHYNGLKYSSAITVEKEPTYYKLATLIKDKKNKDAGWHYEWRFFNGALRYVKEGWNMKQLEIREQIILDRLLRAWSRFAAEKGILCWIAHGPLLSWYWDGLMFPFDIDIDIQMPSSELNRISQFYNMTLVVEDISEGFGKYLIDCSSFIHHRDISNKDNHIDARFIDVDTGTYIDITGLGKNNEVPPNEYNNYINSKKTEGAHVQLYSDRRKHWLNFERINPLHYSKLGGVPVFIPNDIASMLNKEYSKGTTSYYFDGYYYVPQLRLWIKERDIKKIFKAKSYKDGNKVNKKKLIKLIKKMTIDHKIKLLESNDEILTEYYITHKDTHLHEIEKVFMFDPLLQNSVSDLQSNLDYHRLTSKISMSPPFRKALFDYENSQRFRHSIESSEG